MVHASDESYTRFGQFSSYGNSEMLDATFDPDTKLVTVLASGHVTHEDYEAVMIPTVENAAAGGGKDPTAIYPRPGIRRFRRTCHVG